MKDEKARFHITEQIGPKRSRTPDGFLVCMDVPIARVGLQMYAPQELPLDEYDFTPAPDGVYRVHRPEEEVFAPDALLSVVGKPVVNDHPTTDVNPTNWRKLSMGHALHPRRGTGVDDDVLFADLFITDPGMMEEIEAGKREVSCGYDVDYYEISPGVLEQRNIRINHVALVKQGRCGPRCSIGDDALTQPQTETKPMATKIIETHKRSLRDRIMSCFVRDDKTQLARLLEEVESYEPALTNDENGMSGQGVHLHLGGTGGGGDEGPPPWFKEHAEQTDRRLNDLASQFEKFSGGASKDARKGKDEPSEREEMAERIKEKEKEGREAKGKDEEGEEKEEESKDAENEEIEGQLEIEAPEGSEEHDSKDEPSEREEMAERIKEKEKEGEKKPKDRKKSRDSAMLQESFSETVALAEILVPGIAPPTFDRKASVETTLRNINDFRRKTLDIAYHQADTRPIIENIIGPRRRFQVRDYKATDLRTIFRAVGSAKKAANNAKLRPPTAGEIFNNQGKTHDAAGPIKTLTDYQAMLNQHYAPKA